MQTAGLLSLISVLTFNIWGVPNAGFRVVSPMRAERIVGICAELRAVSNSSKQSRIGRARFPAMRSPTRPTSVVVPQPAASTPMSRSNKDVP